MAAGGGIDEGGGVPSVVGPGGDEGGDVEGGVGWQGDGLALAVERGGGPVEAAPWIFVGHLGLDSHGLSTLKLASVP